MVSYVWLGWIPNFEDILHVKERYSYGAVEARLNPEGGILHERDASGAHLALDTLWKNIFYQLPSSLSLEGVIAYLFATLCKRVSPLTSVLLFPSCFPFIFMLREWGLLVKDYPSPNWANSTLENVIENKTFVTMQKGSKQIYYPGWTMILVQLMFYVVPLLPVTVSATSLWNPWGTEQEFSVCSHNSNYYWTSYWPSHKAKSEVFTLEIRDQLSLFCISDMSSFLSHLWLLLEPLGYIPVPGTQHVHCFDLFHNCFLLKGVVCLFVFRASPPRLLVYLGKVLFHLCLK